MILTGEGIPVKSDLPHDETVNYAGLVTNFVKKSRDLVKRLPVPSRKDASEDVAPGEEEEHTPEQVGGTTNPLARGLCPTPCASDDVREQCREQCIKLHQGSPHWVVQQFNCGIRFRPKRHWVYGFLLSQYT